MSDKFHSKTPAGITFIRSIDTRHGGAENFLRRLMHQLKQDGIDCTVMHSSAPKWLPSWVKAWWFNWQTRRAKRGKFYVSFDRIDSADIYRAGDGVHKAFIERRNKKSLNPLHWTYCTLEKRCFHNAKKIIANCEMIKSEIIEHYAINPNKIHVIYNGIDLPSELPNPHSIKQEYQLSPDTPVILFVGTGFDRKGVGPFLEILSQLKSEFHAFVVGKEKHIEPYLTLTKELGLTDKVTFTGMRDDVERFYAAADIFLYPAKYEPFANVCLEAMAHQTVVYTSTTCGVHEVLPTQYVVNANTAEHIDQLITNPSALATAKAEQYEIAKRFSMAQTASQTLALIQEVQHHD